jgi:hypothetical protein
MQYRYTEYMFNLTQFERTEQIRNVLINHGHGRNIDVTNSRISVWSEETHIGGGPSNGQWVEMTDWTLTQVKHWLGY